MEREGPGVRLGEAVTLVRLDGVEHRLRLSLGRAAGGARTRYEAMAVGVDVGEFAESGDAFAERVRLGPTHAGEVDCDPQDVFLEEEDTVRLGEDGFEGRVPVGHGLDAAAPFQVRVDRARLDRSRADQCDLVGEVLHRA